MTLFILVLYILLLAVIAFSSYQKVNNYEDFFIARKRGTTYSVTGSLIATILGGSAVIGAIDTGMNLGWASAWYMLTAAVGLLAIIPFLKRIKNLGRFTLPELLDDVYGRRVKNMSSYVIPLAWLGIIAAQVIASARILNSFIHLQYEIAVVVSAFVFITYTIAGGQISILKTDFVQAILILSGLVLLVYFANNQGKTLPPLHTEFPFNTGFGAFDLFILIITYATSFTVGPDIYSRLFCAKNQRTAQQSILISVMILIFVSFLIAYLSVWSAQNLSVDGESAHIIEIAFSVLPNWLLPLVVLSLLSAVLSSADTTLLSSSIIITDLIERHQFGTKSLNKSRLLILILGLFSMLIALHFTSIIGMLLLALTVYSCAFTIPVIVGLSSKMKIRSKYVEYAILVGGLTGLAGKVIQINYHDILGNLVIVGAFAINGTLTFLGFLLHDKKNEKKPSETSDGI